MKFDFLNVRDGSGTAAQAHLSHSFHRYDGAGHAFQNFLNDANYRESQAEDAWTKVTAFFNETVA